MLQRPVDKTELRASHDMDSRDQLAWGRFSVIATMLHLAFLVLSLALFFLRGAVAVGLDFIGVGVWVGAMSWVRAYRFDDALDLAKQTYWLQKTFGWGRPFQISRSDLELDMFRRQFERSRMRNLIAGAVVGSIWVCLGLWLIARGLGLSQ
jgi:hypothetical protein